MSAEDAFDPQPWGAPTATEQAWAAAVAAAAAQPGAARFDPSADALAARRLLSLAGEGAPRAVLLETWRMLEGARLARDAGLRLALQGAGTAAAARFRFGPAPPRARLSTPEEALALARTPGVVALVDAGASPWWARLLAQPELRVVARLPDDGPRAGEGRILAVARAAPEPTGADETYWVTDAPGSSAALEARLSACGLAASPVAEAGGLKLMALAGYLQPHDERLVRAPGRLAGVIGAAPLPFL
ncbi:MAG: chorismate mutase [Caulobacteraceae bacterium]|nr:chorismate mutase [Caulobacter sp.]